MKTTVEIPDALFREAKRYAAAHDLTFREVIETGLRGVVEKKAPKKSFKLKDGSFGGKKQFNLTPAEIKEFARYGMDRDL